jgi:VCBS repeat-containing protein
VKSLLFLLLVTACAGSIQGTKAELVTDFANLTDKTYERSLTAQTYDLEFTAKPKTGTRDIVASATSSNTDLIPNPTVTLLSESTGSFKLTLAPVAGQTGTTTITLTALLGSLEGQASFTVTITPPNTAPTISDVSDQTINEDANTGALAVTITDGETSAASLTLTGSSSNTTLVPNGNIVFGGSAGNRTVTITPAANQNGSATITLTVSDGSLTATDTLAITVNAVNDSPTISTIADQTTTEDTATSAIAFTIADPETAAASLSISASSSNTTVIPNGIPISSVLAYRRPMA